MLAVAEKVIARSGTFAVGLSSCTPPARGKPVYELAETDMDLGIGISGEPGRERVPMANAREIARLMVNEVLSDLAPKDGADLLMLVNGMGATPHHELYLLAGELTAAAEARGACITRQLVGNFVTSLDQTGAAVTFLELDQELKTYGTLRSIQQHCGGDDENDDGHQPDKNRLGALDPGFRRPDHPTAPHPQRSRRRQRRCRSRLKHGARNVRTAQVCA